LFSHTNTTGSFQIAAKFSASMERADIRGAVAEEETGDVLVALVLGTEVPRRRRSANARR